MKSCLAYAVALAALAVASGASAQARIQFDGDGKPGTIVPFGDLDLSREGHQRLLQQRVRAAVRTLCGGEGERTIGIAMAIKGCENQTQRAARVVMDQLFASGIRSNLGYNGAKIAFSPCKVGGGRILACEVRPVLAAGSMSARASLTTPSTLAPGFTALGDVGHVYRPPDAPEGSRPLIVLLHGAGDDARRFLEMLKPIADERGYIMAAAKPAGATWDVAAALAGQTPGGPMPEFGADVPRLDAMLREVFARAPVDPAEVLLVGFSDGAAYGLSLALANPELFPSVVAFAPGFAKVPPALNRQQRIFIAHGRSDGVIPLEIGRAIADTLRSGGAAVEFREFGGGHSLSHPVLLEALDQMLSDASYRSLRGRRATNIR